MAKSTYKTGTFARFFRAVEGRLVSRYGTARYGKKSFVNATIIGGTRPPMKEQDQRDAKISPLTSRPCNPVEINTEVVTPITHDEAKRYRREYDSHVRGKDLIEVPESAYVEWLKKDAAHAAKLTKKHAELAIKRSSGTTSASGSASGDGKTEPGGSPE